MREILFRGKPINKSDGANSWIEGFYTKSPSGRTRILTTYNARPIEVIPESVGQFTGLTDKNGKKIFEGDILHCIFEDENYIVEWDEIGAGFLFHRINNKKRTGGIDYYEFEDICGSFGFEVIGNIFDHPHLLEEGVQE